VVFVAWSAAGACATAAPPPASTPAQPPREAAATSSAELNCGKNPGEFSLGGVQVSPQQYLARTGAGVKVFSSLTTTKERPLEECGIPGVLNRLVALRCDDGSNPFGGDGRRAHASRRGNVGPGGRCDSIIDLYIVPCPEKTYEVYADSYICPEGTSAWP
jgi:hypothetical protein